MPWILRIFLFITPVLALAYFYSGWKLYHSLVDIFSWSKNQVRFYVIAILVYLNLNPLLQMFFHFSGMENLAKSAREGNRLWDILFSYPFWIGLIIIVEVVPWLLVTDIVKLPFYPFYNRFKSNWLHIQYRIVFGVFILFTAHALFKVIIDTHRIRITETGIALRNLPEHLNGLKIIHISDVQADSRTSKRKIKRYVKKVNRLKPDLVFFTGDLVTSGKKFIDPGAKLLGDLRAKYGVYACLGDHDYWSDANQIKSALLESDIVVMEDKNHFVRIGQDSLLVTFITNTYSRRPDFDKIYFLMGHQPRGAVDIVVTHQPSENVIELAAERGYQLFLCGHTHGGQIIMKPFGLTISPPQFETPYFRGIHHIDQMLVSINNGLGFTVIPLRYRAPAEITLIKLVKW